MGDQTEVGALLAEVAALRERVAILEDERELRTLLARYAFNADLGRSREWVALYTEDGAVDVGGMVASMAAGAPAGYPAQPRFQGHEDLLLKFITALPHRRVEGRSQHHTSGGPLVFHLDGDTATAEGYSTLITRDEDGFRIEVAGVNRWTFRRQDGAWKIVERMMRPIGSPDASQVLSGTPD